MTKEPDRRIAVLSFIRTRAGSDGQLPSLAEIAEACGLASRSAAQKHVKALQAAGELDVTPGKSRSARPKKAPSKASSTSLFEISPVHIGALSDADLRELVGKLAMARLADRGYPTEYVTWGGDQRAADGGVDVRVQMPPDVPASTGFQRSLVGFQVKAMKMPAGEIRKEMCPGGMLRASIREIARSKGAYIIASSESVADKAYLARVAAMKEAAATEAGSEHAAFDFFDARRLADWTNRHAGVVAWVRSRLGQALQGWRPFGQWATTRGAKPHPFLDDTSPRLIDPADPDGKYSLVDGLCHVRALLRAGGSSVRIAGLSGVGKTRFVQALFEERSAPGALSPELAVYTDTSDAPEPAPLALLDELLAKGLRAILIVDNCSSQLHGQLTARCKASDRVSMLSVEYDIREDIPDETSVFRLESGSAELIEQVIRQQFPHISQVNRSTICRFAEGNARVAIALANTVDHKDSLAGISDNALFERLFWQGRQIDPDLLVAAQACALVYSFDAEDSNAELPQLAALADMSPLAFYRHVDELHRRGLAQKRGPWRAVLPHAIANTLAARALAATPYPAIASRLVSGQGRLLRSFSRRLGYLHSSLEAVAIVRNWFHDGGLLSELGQLAAPLGEVLQNVAPVDLETTVQAVERAMAGDQRAQLVSMENFTRASIVRILRSIAWEPKYFERCLALLVNFALAEPEDNRNNSTRDVIKSLFSLYLSGTHATAEQRSAWVRNALKSNDPRVQKIGIQCLDMALEARHFSSHYGFEFGAWSRDYGAYPRGPAVQAWFSAFIQIATEFGRDSTDVGSQVRDTLSSSFRSLWAIARMVDALEEATRRLLDFGWEKGWLAIKQTLRFDAPALPEEIRTRLMALEEEARPSTPVSRTKAVVLNSFAGGLDITDGDESDNSHDRAEQLANELGEAVVRDPSALAELLPQIVENRQGRHWMFGKGMATGALDPNGVWDTLVGAFEGTPLDLRNCQVLRGFLSGVHERDRALFEQLMDAAAARESLEVWVPVLQLSGTLDDIGCARLLRAMAAPNVPAAMFRHLGYGRVTQHLPDPIVSRLLERLARKADGLEVAVDVLSMHVFDNSVAPGPELTRVARELITEISPNRTGQHVDFALGRLIEKFLRGSDAESHARQLLRKIRRGLDDYSLSQYDFDETIAALFEAHPAAALDELVGEEPNEDEHYVRRRDLHANHATSALAKVPTAQLIEWCERGEGHRWENVAAAIPAFEHTAEPPRLCWSTQAKALLRAAPEPIRVAKVLIDRVEPMGWSGSRAEAILARMPLVDELGTLLGPDAADEVCSWRTYIQQLIERERRRELEEHKRDNERFE